VKVHREFRAFVKAATRSGWTVSLTRKGHLRFKAPNGQSYIAPGTPSDHRSIMNTRSMLRRAGLDV
jgi:predicted RNA binding protein YcfA (HicA-like mRNA interferase family)